MATLLTDKSSWKREKFLDGVMLRLGFPAFPGWLCSLAASPPPSQVIWASPPPTLALSHAHLVTDQSLDKFALLTMCDPHCFFFSMDALISIWPCCLDPINRIDAVRKQITRHSCLLIILAMARRTTTFFCLYWPNKCYVDLTLGTCSWFILART